MILVVISLDLNPMGGMLATGSGDNLARICMFFFFDLEYFRHADFGVFSLLLSGRYNNI